MDFIFVNKTSHSLNEELWSKWLEELEGSLNSKQVFYPEECEELVLVFVNKEEMQKLNFEFRSKDKPTDVLSFEGVEEGSLGELVFCYQVIEENSKDHSLSFEEELGYMMIHGVLHLLGYDHEGSEEEAEEMFHIQDEAFEELSKIFFEKS